MKDQRKDFKRLVEKLAKENVAIRLECNSSEDVQKMWKKIVSQYKIYCLAWKDKYYHLLEGEWIYPKDKKMKENDRPLEICILIRLMNETDSRKLSDKQVVKDEIELYEALEKTENLSAILLAELLENDFETIVDMPQEVFLEVFLR